MTCSASEAFPREASYKYAGFRPIRIDNDRSDQPRRRSSWTIQSHRSRGSAGTSAGLQGPILELVYMDDISLYGEYTYKNVGCQYGNIHEW